MAIMQSCCCWRSVRRGSFACAIYSSIYFLLVAVTTGTVVENESEYLAGNRSLPETSSFLESGTISPTTLRFNVTLLVCSLCGVICSLLLMYGLFRDQRIYLIPWILTVIACSIIDVAHAMYLFFFGTPDFNPTRAMLYTLNFFLLCLNIYSLLCVISQYQEYLAGRGTAADDCEYRVPTIRYAAQPTTTATSCLSSRRAATNNETKATTATTTPTQSPTAGQTLLAVEKSPLSGRTSRKHVQFPDTPTASQGEKPDITLTESTARWTQESENSKTTLLPLPDQPADGVALLSFSSTATNQSNPAGPGGNSQTRIGEK